MRPSAEPVTNTQRHVDGYVGKDVLGYELLSIVKSDASGAVYVARKSGANALHKDARAAVKVVLTDDDRTERARRESSMQAACEHPCVAKTLAAASVPWAVGSGAASGRRAWVLVSEWVEGDSLETVLAAGTPLTWGRILALMTDLARALSALSRAGLVHRDIKPSNIMLTASGNPTAVLIDFGHALLVSDTRLTTTGLVLGSAETMAPEQSLGQAIDTRTDLYSVGVVLFRLLTGRVPYSHVSPAEVMRMHCQEPLPPIHILPHLERDVPRGAIDLCQWLLAKDLSKRLPNPSVLKLTLNSLHTSF